MRVIHRVIVAIVVSGIGTATAQAQTQVWKLTPVENHSEIAALVGAASPDTPSGSFGLRFAKSPNRWIAGEVSAEGGLSGMGDSHYRMVTASVRATSSPDTTGKVLFASLGIAAADGLTFRTGPVIGLGIRSAWRLGVVAWRFELQLTPRGKDMDKGRILGGIVVGWP